MTDERQRQAAEAKARLTAARLRWMGLTVKLPDLHAQIDEAWDEYQALLAAWIKLVTGPEAQPEVRNHVGRNL